MHVVQLNFLPAPAELAPAAVLEQWHSLVDIAEATASAGTRVSVIQAAAREALIMRNGIDYHFIDIRGLATATNRGRRFASLLGDLAADVLHGHSLAFAEEAFAVAQCLPRLPIILQDHADRAPPWWRRSQWRRWYAALAGVAFTARGQARPFFAGRLFQPQLRLFAIPESSSRFSLGSRADARRQTGLHGDPCVLWVGHLNAGKDPLSVLDGVSLATQQLPGLQLWCAFGSAPLLGEVQARIARDPRLAGRVHLLGTVTHAQVEVLMHAADLFVAGSLAESCGYAMLEALACGVTPVVTDIPSFRALLGDNRVGYLWPCGDAAGLADVLVAAAARGPAPTQVRAHFDAALSFAAVGRLWADAYARVHADRQRGAA